MPAAWASSYLSPAPASPHSCPWLCEHTQSPSRCRGPGGHGHSPWGLMGVGAASERPAQGVSACALLFTERGQGGSQLQPWSFCPLRRHQSCPLRPAIAGQCLLYCTSTLFLRVVARDQKGQISTLQPILAEVEVNSNVLTHETPLASSNYTPRTK